MKLIHCASELNILKKGDTDSEEKNVNLPRTMQLIVPHLPKYVTNSDLRQTAFSL